MHNNYDIHFPPLFEWQQDVFDEIKASEGKNITLCLKSRRQVGKSILCIVALEYFGFKNEGSIGYIVEPTLSQSRRVFKQMVKSLGGEGSPVIKSSNSTLLELELFNGSQIIFKSAEQREALRGATVKNSILIIDEAAYIEDDIFFILDPIVDATKSLTLIVSTPLFLSGQFYERYKLGVEGNRFVKSFNWSDPKYDQSELLSPEKLEYYRENMTPLKFRSEILGEFIEEGSYIFGDIGKCVNEKAAAKAEPVYGGIDWGAGDGGNSTVLTLISKDRTVKECLRWKDFDSVDLVDVIAEEITKRGLTRVQVEKNSIGKVFLDMLKRKLPAGLLKVFVTTNESKREIIEELIKAFQKGTITIPDDPTLRKQLQHYAQEKTKTGYTYNGADGVEDDYVMSLAFAYDLCPKVDRPAGKFTVSFA